jgi:hypothetical protein
MGCALRLSLFGGDSNRAGSRPNSEDQGRVLTAANLQIAAIAIHHDLERVTLWLNISLADSHSTQR